MVYLRVPSHLRNLQRLSYKTVVDVGFKSTVDCNDPIEFHIAKLRLSS